MTQINTLQQLLKKQAQANPTSSLKFYSPGTTSSPSKRVSYSSLYQHALSQSQVISSLPNFTRGSPVLLHLDNHWDTISFFWAILFADGIPVLSSPLSNVDEHRHAHLFALSSLLNSPVCITRESFIPQFQGGSHTLRIHTIESLSSTDKFTNGTSVPATMDITSNGTIPTQTQSTHPTSETAILMLTSGSTGHPKAVPLTHLQILSSLTGKSTVRSSLSPSAGYGPLLNWIALDHVCSLVEIHLLALWLGVSQIHVPTSDIVSSPLLFPELLSRHEVYRSFAPNFFLAKLVASSQQIGVEGKGWDLTKLNSIMSGGESNDIETMRKVQEFLGGYGAREDIVVPGFGMTETCAGAIFDTGVLENGEGKEVAGLGKCVPGIELRIMLEEGEEAKVNEVGGLELKGDIVFKGYWRNEVATKEAFREDGWFRTGDEAFIDEMGNLNLLGRKKGVVNINGIKIETGEVLKEIEKGLRECGLEVRVVCFASRGKGDITERITVGYFGENITDEERVKVDKVVVESCMMVTGAAGGKPIVFGVVGEQRKGLVPVSSLGKISGAKMRSLFEGGVFDEDVEVHREALERGRREEEEGELTELTELEVIVRKEVCGAIGIEDVGLVRVNDTFFDMGFTSIDLIQLKRLVDVRLETSVPAITFLQHPSVKKLATALVRLGHGSQTNGSGGLGAEYDPVVVFRPTGSKTPLWLIHPGVGEVLIFVRLAEQLAGDDRPIYALRTRGFELGQTPFSSIEETVETYISHIKIHQPNGPYALAGYCYGGMLAFEIAKKLNATSSLEQGVKFQGSFDLPPHIKDRMRQLGWNWCLLYLAQFVDAITEQQLEDEEELILKLSRDEAFDRVMGICKPERLEELGMDKKTLLRWVNVAYELHHIARDYEPSGMVHSIDVFHAYPLRIAAKTRDEWVNDKLSKWKDFCTTAPRFHEVGGEHYTMLGPDHVAGFAKILREALAQRGI